MNNATFYAITISICLTTLGLITSVNAQGPQPQYHTNAAASPGNSIPFAYNASGCRGQQVYPVGTFSPQPPSGQVITKVYFRAESGSTGTGITTYSQFHISLKQANISSLSSSAWEVGMTQVYSSTNFTISRVTGQWFEIELQSPFPYDPTLPLIWDVTTLHTSFSNFYLSVRSNYLPGSYRNYSTQGWSSPTPTGAGAYCLQFGFDLANYSPNDAGVTAVLSPVSDCDGSNQDVEVEISNLGINQINGVEIHWTLNSVIQPMFTYSGLLDTLNGSLPSTANVVIGNMNLAGGNSYDIVAWTEMPNNVLDTVNGNDTTYATVLGYNYPTVNLGLDTITCPNDPITLNAGAGRDSVLWNTSATTQTIVANTSQTYIVDVWKNGCIGGDTINVNFFPAPPLVDLGPDTMICYGDSILLNATTPGVTYIWHDNSTGPTYYADTIGNYSVIIEDANTCKNTDDINVSLFSTPLNSMSVVPRNTICFGSPFEFRANSFTQGSTMYQWKINTIDFGSPTTNNKFSPTLVYGDSVNVDLLTDVCSSTTYAVPSNYITMYLKPEPKLISGKSETDTVLENTSKNYLVPIVQGSTFTWSAVGGSISSPIGNAVAVQWGPAMTSAKILVTEKDAGNCSFTNERNVVIISIVGVKDENHQIGIGSAYPNPANTSITIPLMSSGDWNIDLSLFDITGKKVKSIYSGEVSGNRNFTFAVDDLRSGIYFYKVATQDGYESVKKISIQH